MQFCTIGYRNFRNLKDDRIATGARQVVLVGENGQGKTNFLEAIYVLCYGSSFRVNNARQMICYGKEDFSLSAQVETEKGLYERILVSFDGTKRRIHLDGKEIHDRKELIIRFPCIAFTHDDIEFIRGTPEDRRKFFDQTMSLCNPLFFDDLRQYRFILRQRNAAIRQQYHSLIPLYDEQLAEVGIGIQRERARVVEEFNEIFPTLYRSVMQTDTDIHLVYRPSWANCRTLEDVHQKLKQNRERDLNLQTTTSGIHRDQFIIMENAANFAYRGSTGQMRLVSLLFRLMQIRFYKEKAKKDPIVLLDDVLLELDIAKRQSFLDQLQGYSQAFFTFLPEERYFSEIASPESIRYHVQSGRLFAS